MNPGHGAGMAAADRRHLDDLALDELDPITCTKNSGLAHPVVFIEREAPPDHFADYKTLVPSTREGLAAQPNGPAKILVVSEDWSSDCRRDVPALARLAEAGGLELRIFNRDGKKILGTQRPDPAAYPDGNHDIVLEFLNAKDGGEWASVPVVV